MPAAVATTSWGTPSLDLGAGVLAQLAADGVTVDDVSRCTRESADLYSYRRDGRTRGPAGRCDQVRPMSDAVRRQEIAANLAAVHERIRLACAEVATRSGRGAAGRGDQVLPRVSDVRLLADLGVTDVGENRHQEAEAKVAECADLGLTWHFIGGLQSNKAAAVAAYADVVHSVDRRKLVGPARPRSRRALGTRSTYSCR